jgi:hypothetical protein
MERIKYVLFVFLGLLFDRCRLRCRRLRRRGLVVEGDASDHGSLVCDLGFFILVSVPDLSMVDIGKSEQETAPPCSVHHKARACM